MAKRNPGRQTRTDRAQAAKHIADNKVIEMRVHGMSYAAIGAECGVTGEAARQRVKKLLTQLSAINMEATNEIRVLESMRVSMLFHKLMPKIEAGDVRAIEAANRLHQSMCRLHGIYENDPETNVTPQEAINKAISSLGFGGVFANRIGGIINGDHSSDN